MAVKMRLRRMGAKKAPTYRVIVADSRSPRDGRFIEEIGHFDPRSNELKIDAEKAKKWIANGAQPTDTVKCPSQRLKVLPALGKSSGCFSFLDAIYPSISALINAGSLGFNSKDAERITLLFFPKILPLYVNL